MSKPAPDPSQPGTCPYCQHRQSIDIANSAIGIDCENPECAKSTALGAWYSTEISPNYLAIAQFGNTAYTNEIGKYTLAYMTTRDAQDISSGTLVAIGNHLLIATTAHSIENGCRDLRIVGTKGLPSNPPPDNVLQIAVDRHNDIAVLEITTSTVESLGTTALPIERVHDAGAGDPFYPSRVIGYPLELRREDFPKQGYRAFQGLSYGMTPAHTSSWKKLGFIDVDVDRHILGHYDRTDNIDWISGDSHHSATSPEPGGISGGGHWQSPEKLGNCELWTVDRMKLFGIQSGYFRKKSFLKGVQIAYWLKLVAHNYPDIEEELCETFSRIKSLPDPN